MAGWWKPIEIGVCIERPGEKVDQGSWHYHTVTIPATTPPEKIHEVATGRVLDSLDEVHIHHTWIQSIGEAVETADEEFPVLESEGV